MENGNRVVADAFDALVRDATQAGLSEDVVGRLVLDRVVRLWSQNRSVEDIRSELLFVAENIDPDTDYAFMRP